jgi:hypothetical protein
MPQLSGGRPYDQRSRGENPSSDGYVINRDPKGAQLFRGLLLFVPMAVVATLIWLALGFNKPAPVQPVPITTVVQRGEETSTTTTFITPTLTFGAFDPALGATGPLAVGLLVLIIGALIEMALIVWYGSFYLGDSRSAYPLSLPLGTIRVLVIIMVIFVLLVFALLPTQWGENKAVLFLFGLLSTVVGFYFGSSTGGRSAEGGNTSRNNTSLPARATPPKVQGVQPVTGRQGQSVEFTITGTGFNRDIAEDATLAITPNEKVEVKPVTFVNQSTLKSEVTIAQDAVSGERELTISVPGARVFKGKFTITAT